MAALISVEELEKAYLDYREVVFSLGGSSQDYAGEGLSAGETLLEKLGVHPDYNSYIREILDDLGLAHSAGFLHGFTFALWFMKQKENSNA